MHLAAEPVTEPGTEPGGRAGLPGMHCASGVTAGSDTAPLPLLLLLQVSRQTVHVFAACERDQPGRL